MQNGSLQGPREDMLPNTVIHEDDGRTALHEAASIGDEKTLQTLLNAGANRNAKDRKHGNSPLHEAAWRGYSRSVKLLCSLPPLPKNVKQKSGLNESRGALHSTLLGTRNNGGFSALHLASQNGHNQSCREILLAGADPDVQNNYGDTPLHTACRYGHAGATRILISAKCDPNRTNLNGDTPLHIACAMGRRKLTRILLEAGASPDIKNAQDETPTDIAFRKKLTEIIEILSSPIEVKIPKTNRERSNSNSKTNKDKVDAGQSNKSKNQRSDLVANPVNWSPYGCHYFPDPRSFPAPKLDTLPKEPLSTGEQYFLDLAGNIHKGPVGVGNTCYCGPFFRHIEERISKNRKSLKKYVHKATERLDNKVQALALKTDDQIEQLTKSMLADRIRCDGRRLHLEQWLKRGDPHRTTTGGHHSKSKKNAENVNTLTRCRSLELLGDSQENFHKMPNSKSVEILDETQITIHHDAEYQQSNDCNLDSSMLKNNRRRNQNSSERSRSSGDRIESTQLFNKTGPQNVSQRLEQLLAKTNEILEMEKHVRRRSKEGLLSVGPNNTNNNFHKKRNSKHYNSVYTTDNIKDRLNQITLSNSVQNPSSTKSSNLDNSTKNPEFIENAMKKITLSLGHETEDVVKFNENTIQSFSPDIDLKDFPISQKELERKCDQEHEKSSILSSSSYKDPSSIGSGYIPDFNQIHNNQLRVRRNSKSITSDNSHSSKINTSEIKQELNLTEETDVSNDKFKNLISALKKDYRSTKDAIEAKIRKQSIENASSEEEDDDDDDDDDNEISTSYYHNKELHQLGSCSEDDGDVDGSDYRHRERFYSPDELDGIHNKSLGLGFFKNDSFEDVLCSPVNLISTENGINLSRNKEMDDTANSELPEMTKPSEINDLKNRILNGSNWKSQMLRKTQQILNLNGYGNDYSKDDSNNSRNGIMKKFEIRNSEIKNLKLTPNSSSALKRSKVQELVAKIQGKENTTTIEPELNGHDENIDSEPVYQRLTTSDFNSNETNNINNSNFETTYNCHRVQIQEPQLSLQQFSNSETYTDIIRPINSNELNFGNRNLIPKDAYFHELPNKNHMRPIVDKLPEKQLLNFHHNHHSYSTSSTTNDYIQNVSPTLLASRTRNPLPYNITTSDYSNISQLSSDLYLEKSSPYRNYTNLNSNLLNDNQINSNTNHIHQHKQNQAIPLPAVRHFLHHQHHNNKQQHQQSDKFLGIKKFDISSPINATTTSITTQNTNNIGEFNSNLNYDNQNQSLEQLSSHQQQQQHHFTTEPTDIIITPEQAQFERDLSNDSGFSTKIGGSSLGPSPSLSGNNDYSVIQRNGNATILHNHSNISNNNNNNSNNNSNKINSSVVNDNTNNIQYYIGNTSSLV